MYFLWQYLPVDTNIFDILSSGLDLDFDLFLEKLEFVAAGGISPASTDPDLVLKSVYHETLAGSVIL